MKRKLNSDSNTIYYIYDGEKPVAEYNSGGTLIARNVYGKGIDEILMRTETGVNGSNPFYYGQDHEGSVTHLIDGNPNSNFTGQVIESYKYDVYGAPIMYDKNYHLINNTAYDNRFLFAGREYAATYRGTYVPAFTFYEYRARAYHPALGRFMSEDPKLFDAGDYNFFRYCHNDPIDNVDPMGLQDTVATYSAQQTSRWKADEEYGQAMAAAQWANTTTNLQGSTIGAGMAGYQQWSAVQKASISAQLGRGSGALDGSKTLSGKAILATHSDKYLKGEDAQQGPIIYSDGTVLIHSRHILYERNPDGTLKSLGQGIPMREDVGRNKGAVGTYYTDKWGGVNDNYRVPGVLFTGHGSVTFPQTLFIPGLRATQDVTVHANGSYEIEPSVAIFH